MEKQKNSSAIVSSGKEKKAVLAYLAVCIIWGSTYLAIRIGVTVMPPLLFAGIRFVIAGLILIVFSKITKKKFPENKMDIMRQVIVGLLLLLGGNGLVVIAEQWVASNMAALILAISPLFMALIELFIPNSPRIDWKGWIGLFVGFFGVALLVGNGQGGDAINLGAMLLLITAAFLWACGSIYSKSFKDSGDMLPNIGFQMLGGGLGQLFFGFLMGEAAKFVFPLQAMGAMLYLIIFGSILGYTSYLYLLRVWPAAKAGTYAYINPVVAVILGFTILGEKVNGTMLISTTVILLGVFLVQTSKTKKVEEKA